ncbi:MAG: glycosyl transferase [Bacteroidetes bacterium]|nr:glycosyl transferase [Bacteroidota bacterium]
MLYLLWSITIITSLLCVAYAVMIVLFSYGWLRTGHSAVSSSGKVPVAVIIAARNEENNIGACLEALLAQSYRGKVSVIVVDDHSDDRTAAILREYAGRYPQLTVLNAEGTGKKAAILTGIRSTDAELIITTDADCVMESGWIESIVSFYEATGAAMVVAPVAFVNEKGVFEKMQSLELMALMGSTCGALHYGRAILCNGANLAYRREAFHAVNGFTGIDAQPSGDDVLLMYKISRRYKGGVKFLKRREAIVYTPAKRTLREFSEQRKRWASKPFGAFNVETKAVSLIVYLFCLFIILMALLSAFASVKSAVCQPFFQICLILTGIKCVFDFLLLFLAASFFRKKHYLYLFLPEQFIYVFYVVLAGLFGNRGRFEWKGRKF